MSNLILWCWNGARYPGLDDQAFVVATKGGMPLFNSASEDEAKRFIKEYGRMSDPIYHEPR